MDVRAVFPASLTQLHPMLLWLRSHLQKIGIDESTGRKIELACEEAMVNIIQHGYKEKAGEISLQVKKFLASQLKIIVRDQAPPFNPLEHDISFDRLAPLEKREIGGLGIFLMSQYMDELDYAREGNTNVLTLVKNLG